MVIKYDYKIPVLPFYWKQSLPAYLVMVCYDSEVAMTW